MDALLNILFYSIGSIIIGVVLTVMGVILMYVLIHAWRKNSAFTPLSFLVGIVLFFFLAFQSILLCGTVTIKSYSNDMAFIINQKVEELPQDFQLSTHDSQQLLENICEDIPVVGYYLGGADFRGHTPLTIAEAMVDEMNSFMNWFIFRRVLWAIFFVAAGAAIVIKTMETSNNFMKRAPSIQRHIYDD